MSARWLSPAARRRVAYASGASLLLICAAYLPFWQMTLHAPQYPAGLRLIAYGTEVVGDLREINIINHYIGMEHVDTVPAPEMSLFPVTLAALTALGWLGLAHRRLAQLAVGAMALAPLIILADLQWWLHSFGRNLNPAAPLRVEPFTPWAVGWSTIGNFISTAWPSWGFFAMWGAAGLLFLGLRTRREDATKRSASAAANVAAAAMVVHLVAPYPLVPGGAISQPLPLQERLDAASPGDTVEVSGGVFAGPITINGPLTVVGVDHPVIVGPGVGSVVNITGEGVTFEGFTIRNSGRAVTEEAAGIKVAGSRHVIRRNIVEDVYFGIHLSAGGDNVVAGNAISPGREHGARPGHAISLWNQSGVQLLGNSITAARDGIYMSFADNVFASGNHVQACRYGVHSMYSEDSTFEKNRLERNLLGAALMYSDRLRMRCNVLSHNRQGATAYGVLLKDIDGLELEENLILANRVGIYADNTPVRRGGHALLRNNVIVGNDTALALQSNVALTFYGNQVADNLTDVRAEGARLSAANAWSWDGSGNYWDRYRGYDADGDGIGDVPYRYEMVMNELIGRTPLARAFAYAPASIAIERAARLFPLYRPEPLLIDPDPLMRKPLVPCAELPQ